MFYLINGYLNNKTSTLDIDTLFIVYVFFKILPTLWVLTNMRSILTKSFFGENQQLWVEHDLAYKFTNFKEEVGGLVVEQSTTSYIRSTWGIEKYKYNTYLAMNQPLTS